MATSDSDPAADGASDEEPTREAVRDRLDRVTDPELDESIVALDYVTEVAIDDDRVSVSLVLPTAWCSPAFAWMMATDARDEVEALPAVERATVSLEEHVHGEEITRGVAVRAAFSEVFEDAEDGVEAVRADLDRKARLARQFDAMEALLDAGATPEQVATLERGAVRFDGADDRATVAVRGGSVVLAADADPIAAYLRKARATGVVAEDGDRLFATPEGDPVAPDGFELVRRRSRLAKVNMSGQGSVCAALNESRRESLELGDAG
jgi:metal-sulfur cluster biosynthetic enzyme